jgi:hypothetical protein
MILGPMAKLGLGTAIAIAGVGTAGAAGALPAAADHAVRHAIEVVSPVEFAPAAHHDHPDNFGRRVSADATGESDGSNGVDGQTISAEAPGAAHRADGSRPAMPPGQSGLTGAERANQTPAADHTPDTPGANAGDAGDPDGDGAHGSASGPPATTPDRGSPDHP